MSGFDENPFGEPAFADPFTVCLIISDQNIFLIACFFEFLCIYRYQKCYLICIDY